MAKFKPRPMGEKLNRDTLFGTSLDLPRVIEVSLAELHPNPDQPRRTFREATLRELAESIRETGLIQPIIVKRRAEGGFLIVAGERRFRACQLLGRETLPAIPTDGNVDEISLIENIQREDLHPLEEAEALARMIERYHYTQTDLARIVGKAQNSISEILLLTALPEDIRTDYRTSDTVSKSAMIEVARVKDAAAQRAIWSDLRAGGTVRVARARKKAEGTPLRAVPKAAARALVAGKAFLKALSATNRKTLTDRERAELEALAERIRQTVAELTKASSRKGE